MRLRATLHWVGVSRELAWERLCGRGSGAHAGDGGGDNLEGQRTKPRRLVYGEARGESDRSASPGYPGQPEFGSHVANRGGPVSLPAEPLASYPASGCRCVLHSAAARPWSVARRPRGVPPARAEAALV